MNLEEYHTLFIAATLVLSLMVAAPTLSMIVPIQIDSERFSELWLLGPNHLAEEYPFNVRVLEDYRILVDVSNHMGFSKYYVVYVKFRNQTRALTDSQSSMPSPLESIYEFHFVVENGETWEKPFLFSFRGEPSSISHISVNGLVFPVNCSSKWNSAENGFFYQLFFELWIYDETSLSLRYHNRFVGLWLNMTD